VSLRGGGIHGGTEGDMPVSGAAATRRGLELWRRALVAGIASDAPDLTQRQIALLLTVYLAPPPHTVRGLAQALAIAKPAVTRAVTTLARHGLVRRRGDERDRRNVLIERTVRGAVFRSDLGERIAAAQAP